MGAKIYQFPVSPVDTKPLVQANFMILLSRNREMKEKVDDFILHEMGLIEHAVVVKEDEQGNKTIEKYYPPLKVLQ